MIYKAVVVDNTEFYRTGKLIVKISGKYFSSIAWDLEEDFNNESQQDNEDPTNPDLYEVFLSGASGGGRNYGLFVLPQINEKGLVDFLDERETVGVWVGSLYYPVYEKKELPDGTVIDDKMSPKVINIPSNKFEDGENSDGSVEQSPNQKTDELKTNLIYRTKNTNKENADNIAWENNYTTNIISIGKEGIEITHFKEDDWEDGSNKGYKKVELLDNKINTEIVGEEEEKRITLEEGKINTEIVGEEEEKRITLEEGKINTEISDGSQTNKIAIDLNNGISIEAPDQEVIVNSKEANITGDTIIDGTVAIKGASDTAVLYSELKKLIEAFEKHIHVAPSGPTAAPLNSDMSPIVAKTTTSKINMESKSTELD